MSLFAILHLNETSTNPIQQLPIQARGILALPTLDYMKKQKKNKWKNNTISIKPNIQSMATKQTGM